MRLQCSHCPFWLAHMCQGHPSSGFPLFLQVVILYYHEAIGMTLGTGWCCSDAGFQAICSHSLLGPVILLSSIWMHHFQHVMMLLLCLGRSSRTQLAVGGSEVHTATLCTMTRCSVLAKACQKLLLKKCLLFSCGCQGLVLESRESGRQSLPGASQKLHP